MFYGQNSSILKSGKFGHFAKAAVRQNRHKWRTLGLNSQNHTKNESQHTQDIFYGKNG